VTKRNHEHTSRRWVVAISVVGVLVAILASTSWPASAPSQVAVSLGDADSTQADVPAAPAELADSSDGEPDDRVRMVRAAADPAARFLVRVRYGDVPGINSLVVTPSMRVT
jgi:hypothetical protein